MYLSDVTRVCEEKQIIVSKFFNFAQYKVILAENFELNAVGEWLPTFRKMMLRSPSRVRHLKIYE